MDRHQFDTADRDGLVAELTEQRVRGWIRLLLAGDKRATNDLQNTVLDRLTEVDAKALFVQAVTEPAAAGATFTALVGKVMRDQCEAEAEQAVDDMEQNRLQEVPAHRIPDPIRI